MFVRSAAIGFALVLATACKKSEPVELRTRELPDCGPIVALTEVDGRVYGVSDRPTHLATPKASACAFDLDTQLDQLRVDALTWDGHPIVGGNTQLVDGNGVQTIVGSWFSNEGGILNVGLLRRTSAGLEQVTSVQQKEARIPMGKLDAVQIGDRVLVGFTRDVHDPSCIGKGETPLAKHRIWRVGDELDPNSFGFGTAERIAIVGDDLVVAGIADELLVQRVPAKSDSMTAPRWVAQLHPRDGEGRPKQVLDVEVIIGSVYVLSQGNDRVWLSRVSADSGEVGWSLVGDGILGELSQSGAHDVRVTTLARQGSEHELRRFEVGESGEVGPTRTTAVPGVGSKVVLTTLALGEGERVWLGGYLDSGGEDLSPGWVGMLMLE